MAQYSRPATEEKDPFEDEAKELMNPTDHLSMKFAMPPVAQVSPVIPTVPTASPPSPFRAHRS